MTAMTILPIGSNSLCYGSNDGGATTFATDSKLNEIMEKVGKKINLANHRSLRGRPD
jgi:hypothetical protein